MSLLQDEIDALLLDTHRQFKQAALGRIFNSNYFAIQNLMCAANHKSTITENMPSMFFINSPDHDNRHDQCSALSFMKGVRLAISNSYVWASPMI